MKQIIKNLTQTNQLHLHQAMAFVLENYPEGLYVEDLKKEIDANNLYFMRDGRRPTTKQIYARRKRKEHMFALVDRKMLLR